MLVACSAALAALGDLAGRLPAALAVLGVAAVAWVLAVRRVEASAGVSPRAVLLVALLMRLPLLVLPPSLSDDALRYLWDGRVIAAGANPYRLAPESEALAPLRDELWQRLPHRRVPTVYPPLALGAFSIAAASPLPMLTWKAFAGAGDLAVCALLLALLRRRGRGGTARAAWYAWCPLAALESAGMGHVDAVAVAAAVAAVVLLLARPSTRTTFAAAGAAAAGVLVKLAPLAALPLWARTIAAREGGRRRAALFLAVALAATALGLVPVVVACGGVPPGLVVYGVSWEWNGPLYEPLWRALDAADAAGRAARAVDAVKEATGHPPVLDRLYPWLYPQFLAKLLLAAGALAAVAASLAERDPVAGSRRLFGRLLLCAATVYPWYLLWVLPWAAADRHRPWLLAAALAPLAYLPQHGGAALFPGVWAAVWLPPAALAGWEAWRRRTAGGERPGAEAAS